MMKLNKRLTTFIVAVLTFMFALAGLASIAFRTSSVSAEPSAPAAESWYDIEVGSENESFRLMLSAEPSAYSGLKIDDLKTFKDEVVGKLENLIIDRLVGQITATSPEAVTFALDAGNDEGLLGKYKDNYKQFIKDRLTQEGELDKYLNGEYDVLLKYAVSQYMEENEVDPDKMEQLVKEVTDVVKEVIETSEEIPAEQKQAAKDIVDNRANDIVESAEAGTLEITPEDFIASIREISLDGAAVFENGSLSFGGIRNLLSSLPKLSEIAEFSDEQMRLTYSANVSTSFGDVDFSLTVGLKGDCSQVRKAAKFLADHIMFEKNGGDIRLVVKTPSSFTKILARIANSESVPEDVRRALFEMTDMTGSELADKANSVNFEKFVEYVESVDFSKLFSNLLNADYLNGFFADKGIHITEEKIESVLQRVLSFGKNFQNTDVKEVENFLKDLGLPGIPAQLEAAANDFIGLLKELDFENFDLAKLRSFLTGDGAGEFIHDYLNKQSVKDLYDNFLKLIKAAADMIPERLSETKLTTMYDAEGNLSWSGDISFNLNDLIGRLTNALESRGITGAAKYTDVILSFFPEEELNRQHNFNVDFKAVDTGLYKISYELGEETVTGLLPEGADFNFFANATEANGKTIKAWVEAGDRSNVYEIKEGEKLPMPARNLTLVPVTDFDVVFSAQDGGEDKELQDNSYTKDYDRNAVTLTAAPSGGTGYAAENLTYSWYKVVDGEAMPLEADGDTLTLTTVAESGVYRCVVTNELAEGVSIVVQSEDITVTINVADVSFAEARWSYTEPLKYNGKDQTVTLENAPEGYDFTYGGTQTAKDIDTYSVWITLDDENYNLVGLDEGTEDNPFEWEITRGEVSFKNAHWSYTEPLKYNGRNQTVTLEGAPEGFGFTYGGTQIAKDIDSYEVWITLDDENYDIVDLAVGDSEENPLQWEITRGEVSFAGAEWSYTAPLEYNGRDQSVTLENTPAGFGFTYGGTQTATGVNTYTVWITLDDPNYDIKDLEFGTADNPLEWKIIKGNVSFAGAEWDYDEPFKYDGENHSVMLKNTPAGIEFTYGGTREESTVGTFTVWITLDDENYNIVDLAVGDSEANPLEWEIVKGEISFAEAHWSYTEPFVYDGRTHSVTLENAPEIDFTYGGVQSASSTGTYNVWIELTDTNYNIVGLEKGDSEENPFEWKIIEEIVAPPEYEVFVDDVKITVSDNNSVLPDGASLTASDKKASYTSQDFVEFMEEGQTPELLAVYDISFGGFAGTGSFTVTINDSSWQGKNLIVVHIHNGEKEKITSQYAGGALSFQVDGFSDFAVVEAKTEEVPPVAENSEDNDGVAWWIWLLLALIILFVLIVIIAMIVILKVLAKRRLNDEDEPEPPQPEEPQPQPEEPQPQPEEPQPEVVPAHVADETAAAVIVPVVAPEEDELRKTYVLSFQGRLSQAEEEVKSIYSELKNEILSYKGVKSRVSQSFDSFNIGRNKCVKMLVRKKYISMYIALNPAEVEPKYHVKDVSDVARYESVPSCLKVRSPRSVKYAKQLVEMLMTSLGAEKGEVQNVDYTVKYQTDEELVKAGLAKVQYTKRRPPVRKKQ